MEYAKGKVNSAVTNELDNSQVKTRADHRKQRKEEETNIVEEKPVRMKRLVRLRLIPIWLRLLIIIGLIVLSAVVGVIVGYSVIGNGEPTEALDKSTWQHIIDLVVKDKE
ncbi:DNA-directed RNA polymerase subunit beta [Bacillus sp. PS06]|uniref:DNA-directed RNA polymerase subunit beta n=1 Tax=Bacillus sp. PS06 TaxID=2764176 RepID=UPI00178177DF|nr:DNA-directed RNA polymerase subunit beta [Bacillus sp. PS06]MBD8069457.1 DNA-directed RNA polymerase subunit beta [Bacillus sp. PS06]